LLDHLKAKGMMDDTIVVVVADHGEEFEDHGQTYHGKTLYEESVKIPLVVHVPGFRPGRVDKLVAEIDIAPTLCRLVGLPIPPDFKGKPIRAGHASFRPSGHRRIYLENYLDEYCVEGVRSRDWKLVKNCDGEARFELYDLVRDPKEKENLFGRLPEQDKIMRGKLRKVYRHRAQTEGQKPELPADLAEQLKGLGYLQ